MLLNIFDVFDALFSIDQNWSIPKRLQNYYIFCKCANEKQFF